MEAQRVVKIFRKNRFPNKKSMQSWCKISSSAQAKESKCQYSKHFKPKVIKFTQKRSCYSSNNESKPINSKRSKKWCDNGRENHAWKLNVGFGWIGTIIKPCYRLQTSEIFFWWLLSALAMSKSLECLKKPWRILRQKVQDDSKEFQPGWVINAYQMTIFLIKYEIGLEWDKSETFCLLPFVSSDIDH